MAPEQAPCEGVAESLSLDNKTGSLPLLEGAAEPNFLSWLTVPPLWNFPCPRDSGWPSWRPWLSVCPAGIAVKPLCPSPPWLCPCPLPTLGTGLEGGSGKVPDLPAPWEGVLLGWRVVALFAWAEGQWPSPFCIQKRHHCSNFGRGSAPLLSLQSSSCLVPSPSQEGEVGQDLHSLPGSSA